MDEKKMQILNQPQPQAKQTVGAPRRVNNFMKDSERSKDERMKDNSREKIRWNSEGGAPQNQPQKVEENTRYTQDVDIDKTVAIK